MDYKAPRNEIAWWVGLLQPRHKPRAVLFVCGGRELLFVGFLYLPETGLLILHTEQTG